MPGMYKKKEGLKKKDGTPLITGRKQREIDEKLLVELATIQCTDREIANILNISTDLLHRRFRATIKNAREAGKSSLRRVMWKKAVYDENTTMMIWMSKNILGFSEKHVVESKNADNMDKHLVIDFGEIKKPYISEYARQAKAAVDADKAGVKEKLIEAAGGPEG